VSARERRSAAARSSEEVQRIELTDGQRVVVVDHGELGAAVLYEERADMERTDAARERRRWATIEETLIPREAIEKAARAMLATLGKAFVVVEAGRADDAKCDCPMCGHAVVFSMVDRTLRPMRALERLKATEEAMACRECAHRDGCSRIPGKEGA
jgi:hypothetical protein